MIFGSYVKMVRSTKSPRKTKNVTLKSVSLFFKQLTVASVAASFYAMTFVVFVGLSAPLALCFDPIYWGETPFRNKSVLSHVRKMPQAEYVPITHTANSSRVADLTGDLSKCVIITFCVITGVICLISKLFRYFTN
jgi:hypothetical protein